MIWIVWRGSGILVLIYFFLSAWICSYWFEDTRFGNSDYLGWTLFYAAIAASLHAFGIYLSRKGHDENDPEPPKPLLNSHLFFIPVMFWPLILGGLSAKFLFESDPSDRDYSDIPVQAAPEEKVLSRTINFLNTSEDTMYYEISGDVGAYEYEIIEPRTYISKTLDPGKYFINGMNADGEVIFTFPSDHLSKDKKIYSLVKTNKGKMLPHRLIRDGTTSEKDYDDIWVVLNGERDMIMVEVTSLCNDSLNKAMVSNTDWTKLTTLYDGTDIIEPLYQTDPGKGSFTVLATGEDIPQTHKKSERVFALFSMERGTQLTNEYLAGRVMNRCPSLAE
jgi:hypothetical protein